MGDGEPGAEFHRRRVDQDGAARPAVVEDAVHRRGVDPVGDRFEPLLQRLVAAERAAASSQGPAPGSGVGSGGSVILGGWTSPPPGPNMSVVPRPVSIRRPSAGCVTEEAPRVGDENPS